MNTERSHFDWQTALTSTYHEYIEQLLNYLPQLVGALILFAVGWFAANLIRKFAKKLVLSFESLILKSTEKMGLPGSIRSYADLTGNIIFWALILFFAASSANMLDLQIFSVFFAELIGYLPKVFAALVIVLVGVAFSNLSKIFVASAAENASIQQSDLLAQSVRISIVLMSVVIAIQQLGIHIEFLTNVAIVIIGVLLSGVALAFGLGARKFLANVIGSRSASQYLQVGQQFKIGDIEGRVLDISTTNIVLDTAQGHALIPASILHEQVHELLDQPTEFENEIVKKSEADTGHK